jgi:hypothetical protein
MIFVIRPISAVSLAIGGLLLLSTVLPYAKKRRSEYKSLKKED